MGTSELTLWRLRVVADADPCVIARVVERFQNLNIVPRRIVAEVATNDLLHCQVDVFGMPESQLNGIAAKLAQSPSIVNVHWSRI